MEFRIVLLLERSLDTTVFCSVPLQASVGKHFIIKHVGITAPERDSYKADPLINLQRRLESDFRDLSFKMRRGANLSLSIDSDRGIAGFPCPNSFYPNSSGFEIPAL